MRIKVIICECDAYFKFKTVFQVSPVKLYFCESRQLAVAF